jgi:predicted O-methyltransferase YrrM
MGEIKLDRRVVGSFANMKQVIDNWELLDKGCVTQSRWDYMRLMLDKKEHVWDHNVALVYLINKLKPKSYFEIGVLTCGSMVHALAAPIVKRVVGIDMFSSTYAGGQYIKNKDTLKICEKQVKNAVIDKKKDVRFIKGNSCVEIARLKESFDLALVDGAHDKQGAYNDLKATLPKVKKAIVFDDIHHPSHVYLEEVAYRFAAENKLDYTVNHQPPGTVIFWLEAKKT